MILFITVIVLLTLLIARLVFRKRNDKDAGNNISRHCDDDRPKYKSYTRKFRIAGVSNKCNRKDIGPIIGKVALDPTNEFDKNAIAIIANPEQKDEKLLGYIPKDDQATYMNFAYKEKELPFTGYIEEFETEDGRKSIFGKIKVYYGKDEDVENDMMQDVKFLAEVFNNGSYDRRMEALRLF